MYFLFSDNFTSFEVKNVTLRLLEKNLINFISQGANYCADD